MSALAAQAAPLRIALAGGGTGGHIAPGLHLVESTAPGELADLLWFTSGRAVEERVLARLERLSGAPPHERVRLDLEPAGGGAPSLARLALRSAPNVARARAALRRHRSEVLLALGGFTALPAVLAARSLGLPVALLELNAKSGRATRVLAPLAARVFHAWGASLPGGRESERHRRSGAPLPPALTALERQLEGDPRARAALGFAPDRALLVVLGGSQGAASLNAFVARELGSLVASGIQVLHQTGPGRALEGVAGHPAYRALEYVDDVPSALRAATLALARGGASTLAELAAARLPAIVVPYPHHPDRHQEHNARELGAGVRVVADSALDAALARELARLASPAGAAERAAMSAALAPVARPRAAAEILRELALLARPEPALLRSPA